MYKLTNMAHACPMCSDFTAPTFQLLQLHLFRVHSGDFHVTCCMAHFTSASSYRKHLQRHHRDQYSKPCDGSSSSLENHNGDPVNEVENTSCAATQPTQCMNKRNTAMWVLRLKETQKLTQTCVDSMLQDITELCTVTVSELGGAVDSILQSAGINMHNIPGLCEVFTHSSSFCRPFDGLDTYYRQLAFYKSHLKFVVSKC